MLQGSHKGASPPSTGGALWGDCCFMHEYRRDHQLVVLKDSSLNPLGKLVGSIAVRAPLHSTARLDAHNKENLSPRGFYPLADSSGFECVWNANGPMSLRSSELEGSTIVRFRLGPPLVQRFGVDRARICTCHRRLKCAPKGSRSSMGKDIRRPQPRPQAIIM